MLLITVLLLIAPMAQAQEDDRSHLVRLIEDALSDGARTVRIEGFAGALSSTATLDRLTIADAEGVWLTIEGAELAWARSALLRGRLEVDRLSAERVVLDRLPPSGDSTPSPEATPFSLPELPVSISLGALALERVELGAAVLGFPVTATTRGSASLDGGDGAADLTLDRLDGPRGAFALSASYSNATGLLDLDLTLEEDRGGIAATLLNLPDRPSLALDLAGEGPLDDLTVTLALATDGQPRVTGQLVSARDAEGPHRITAALNGDLAPLMQPDYRPFFGAATALEASLLRPGDGTTVLERIALQSAALTLDGAGVLDAEGVPLRLRLDGRIADTTGAPVRLPIPGTAVRIGTGTLAVGYDRTAGDTWTAEARVQALDAGDLTAGEARLSASGTLAAPSDGPLGVTYEITAALDSLGLADPALQTAVGDDLSLTLEGRWQEGAPLLLDRIEASGATASLDGTGRLTAAGARLLAELDLTARLPDLSPFSALAGEALSGATTLQLSTEAELLSGAFSADAVLDARNLTYGTALPPALLAGETRIETALTRDETGLTLHRFALSGSQVSASAEGRLSSAESALTASARLADAGLLTTAISGPVEAEATLSRDGSAPWQVDAEASGQGGLSARLAGAVDLPGNALDLTLSGAAPLALADRFIAPRSLRGTARFDLALAGAPALSSLSGTVTTEDARVSLPEAGLVLEALSATARLSGASVGFSGNSRVQAGGSIGFDGTLDMAGPALPGRVELTLSGVALTRDDLFETVIDSAAVTVSGALAAGPLVSGTIRLGQTDIRLDTPSFGAAEPIPEIRHQGESAAQFATRDRAGLTGASGGPSRPLGLDLSIEAPTRIFLRGSGLDAELGGAIRLGGTTAAVQPSGQFALIRGRLSFLGQRFDITEATATLQGSLDPWLRVVAETRADEIVVRVTIEGPASAPALIVSSVPDLPEDEILARLFFGRSATSLSPVQALRLVDAVSGAAGGQGLIGGLRDSLGLADFDLTTNAAGETELRFGRYLSENIYTDLQVGTGGAAEASVNIDLTPSITARGSVTSSGESSIGLFFERDY